ncbi:YgaP family membrane protein [Rhodobacter capsulatus]|uniref:YgaP family membrane protein n=1 Tax=Rhodobacter capsulatus TaxID=1061 RepID=UPI0040271196
MFKTNVGGLDKIARIAAGVLLLLAGFLTRGEGAYNWIFLIGVVPLATGLLNTCPLYTLIGLNTCKR